MWSELRVWDCLFCHLFTTINLSSGRNRGQSRAKPKEQKFIFDFFTWFWYPLQLSCVRLQSEKDLPCLLCCNFTIYLGVGGCWCGEKQEPAEKLTDWRGLIVTCKGWHRATNLLITKFSWKTRKRNSIFYHADCKWQKLSICVKIF